MKVETHRSLGRIFISFILAVGIFLALWILVPPEKALAQAAPVTGHWMSPPNSVFPAPLAQATVYTTTTSIVSITSLHPAGASTFMVGFAVEVNVEVRNVGRPGNDNPTGYVDITTNPSGPSCLTVPITASGNRVSSATCTLFFTTANNYTISANFLANATWGASSDTSGSFPVNALSLSPSLSAGRLHTCSLAVDGILNCWGLSSSFPTTSQTGITNASAGGYHTCVTKTDGTLSCWGDNTNITTAIPGGNYLGVNSGKDHACAIGTDYLLECWGDPESLPLTTTVGLSVPTVPVVAVSAGNNYDCAIRESDSTLACWGDPGFPSAPTVAVKAVSVGERHACVIREDNNQVQCWGYYTNFSFGTTQYSQIDSGSDYTCAQRISDNTLVCSGANIPPISNSIAYATFSSGFLHTCALTAPGTTYLDCAGANGFGQAPQITLAPISIIDYLPKDRPWSQAFTVSGGAAPPLLSQTTGSLPTGVQLNGFTLEGTPTTTGLFNFTLDANETFSNSTLPYQLKLRRVGYATTVEDATTAVSVTVSASTPAGSPVTVNISVTKTAHPELAGSVIISGTTATITNTYEAGCTASVDSSGNAECVLFFPTEGDKNITAKYTGNAFYFASPESSTNVTIQPVVIHPAISAGSDFNCSLNANGTLYCWGKNDSDQTLSPSGIFDNVSAGRSHACARGLDGRLYCWGWNGYNVSNPPTYAGFISVTSGATHACGLLVTGETSCWGNAQNERTFVPVASLFTQISAGDDHTCGLDTAGSAACWGVSTDGRTTPIGGPFNKISSGGTFTCGIESSDGSLSCWGVVDSPPGGTGYKDLEAGSAHVCAIRSDDTLVCWGDNASGQASPPSGTFSSVSAGLNHTCGIRSDGFMLCWGNNSDNQAPGIEILPVSLPTIDVDNPWSQALVVSGGREQPPTYIFSSSGDLPPGLIVDANSGEISGMPSQPGHFSYNIQAVERNLTPALVQLRTYTQTVRSSVNVDITSVSPTVRMVGKPVQVFGSVSETPGTYMGVSPTLTVSISTNDGLTCSFILVDGSGSCFLYFTSSGDKEINASYGGDANFIPGATSTPTTIFVDDFAQQPNLHTGTNRTLIHQADGSLRCLGSGCPLTILNSSLSIAGIYPAVGVGDALICVMQTDGQVRCQVDGQPAITHTGQYTSLSVGAAHACAIDVYGDITCWGANNAGQSAPQVGPFNAVSAGANHTCAIHNDGSLLCWGSVPGTPPSGTFTSINAGTNHTCALSTGGTLSCWGNDTYGQSSLPGGGIFQAVSLGDWHTCGLKQDGTLACWGLTDDQRSNSPYGTFSDVASATDHNCALRIGPKLTCWGKDTAGEAPRISITPLSNTEIPALSYWEHGFYPTGGTTPYQGFITTGSLPLGVQLGVYLSPAGIILYGTPEVPDVYPFAIAWEDSSPIPLISEQPFSITVTGADLQIDIRPASPTTAMYRNPFSFQYQITNNTALDAPDVQLNITLPEGLSEINTSGLSGCSQTGLAMECSLISIAAHEIRTLTVSGQVTASVGQILTTTAEIQPQLDNWPEVAPDDNTDSASVQVTMQFVVLDEHFDTAPPDMHWSAGDVIISPNGINYLGDFANSDQVRLTLNNLPPHRRAIVSFDLYISGPWQGNTPPVGLWEFGEWGQPTLLTSTFCNQETCQQSYPANYPLGSFPWRTGANGWDELGYSGVVDTRYHLSFNLQHTDMQLDLLFSSLNLPAGALWGLDNVRVTLDWSAYSISLPVIYQTMP